MGPRTLISTVVGNAWRGFGGRSLHGKMKATMSGPSGIVSVRLYIVPVLYRNGAPEEIRTPDP